MRRIFRDHPEAADNTLLIAERCEISFEKRDLMPRFPVPESHTEGELVRARGAVGHAAPIPGRP